MDYVAPDQSRVRHRIREEAGQLFAKKSKEPARKSFKSSLKLPLISDVKTLVIVPRPALDEYPKGLAVAEFAHLTRCNHSFPVEEIAQKYRDRYAVLRDMELLDGLTHSEDKIDAVVALISSAKLLCGMFSKKKTFSAYRKMLVDLMKFSDSLVNALHENISRCSSAELHVGDVVSVAKGLLEACLCLPFLRKSCQYLSHFCSNTPAKCFKRVLAFHSCIICFKMDCMAELISFCTQTRESPPLHNPQEAVEKAESRFRNAFRNRKVVLFEKSVEQMRVASTVNQTILSLSSAVWHRLNKCSGARSSAGKLSAHSSAGGRQHASISGCDLQSNRAAHPSHLRNGCSAQVAQRVRHKRTSARLNGKTKSLER